MEYLQISSKNLSYTLSEIRYGGALVDYMQSMDGASEKHQ